MMDGRFYGIMFEKGNAFSVDADEKEGPHHAREKIL
jgi:hypothetical protein